MLIFMYLAAIVAANLSVHYFGISAVYFNAFVFIGLDLTARDKLHEKWQDEKLFLKMAVLIFAGSAISFLLNKDSFQISIASFIAFSLAGIIDSAMYHFLPYSKTIKVNGSNIAAAMVDSVVFPFIAFGSLMPSVTVIQFICKVAGGFIWSLILKK